MNAGPQPGPDLFRIAKLAERDTLHTDNVAQVVSHCQFSVDYKLFIRIVAPLLAALSPRPTTGIA